MPPHFLSCFKSHKTLNFLKKYVGNNELSAILVKNVFALGFIKPLSIVLSIATFTLCVHIVDSAEYGLFSAITAFTTWFSLFDLGIGNGLKNHLTLAIEQKDDVKARKLVSTAYFYIGSIFGGLLVIYYLITPFVDWTDVFHTKHNSILTLVSITVLSFVLRTVLQLLNNVLLAYQASALVESVALLGQIIQFLLIGGVYWGHLTAYFDLVTLCLIQSFSPVVVLIGLHIVGFYGKKWTMPTWKFVDKNSINAVFNLGSKFLLIQIAALVIFSLNQFLINKWFNAELVTEFNAASRYYSVASIGIGILLTPYWSLLTKAIVQGNYTWIKNLYGRTLWIWLVITAGSVLQFLLSNWVFELWLRDRVRISNSLNWVCFIYSIILNWNAVQATFLNGMSKIKLQLYIAIIGMLIYYPVAVFLAGILGPAGIVWATCVCLLLSTILCPIQVYKLVSNPQSTSKRLWNA